MKNLFCCLIAALISIPASAQPGNDDCSNAERLCNGTILSGTTTAATATASSDNGFCYVPAATVWYVFTTDSNGGDVTIDFTNLSFNPDASMGQQIQALIFSAGTPCDQTSYLPFSACGMGAANFSVTSAVSLAANTTYYVQVNGDNTGVGVTQPAQCDFEITISGTGVEYTSPTAGISAVTTTICQGDDETISATVADCSDTSSFEWYFDNALYSNDDSGTISSSGFGGSGYLKLIVNCGNLCVYSDTTDSIYFDVTLISADAGPDKYITAGDQVTLDGSGNGLPDWVPGTSLLNADQFTPIASPSSTTTYFLTVTNGNCTATDSVNVFVGQVIIIYSGFTPNNDDINDKWIITNSSQFPNMDVRVYDRSGQQVFQSIGYSTQEKWWDGTLNNSGKELPASTYYYVINLNDSSVEEQVYKGMVTIIR